jgi:hypothetical protein
MEQPSGAENARNLLNHNDNEQGNNLDSCVLLVDQSFFFDTVLCELIHRAVIPAFILSGINLDLVNGTFLMSSHSFSPERTHLPRRPSKRRLLFRWIPQPRQIGTGIPFPSPRIATFGGHGTVASSAHCKQIIAFQSLIYFPRDWCERLPVGICAEPVRLREPIRRQPDLEFIL